MKKYTKKEVLEQRISFKPLTQEQLEKLCEHFGYNLPGVIAPDVYHWRFYGEIEKIPMHSTISYLDSFYTSTLPESTKEIYFEEFIFELPEEYIVECEGTQSLEVYFTYYTDRINGKYKYILVCEDKYTLHICNDIKALDIEYQNLPIVSYEFWKSFQEELKVGDWVKLKSREECQLLRVKDDPGIVSGMYGTFGTYQPILGIDMTRPNIEYSIKSFYYIAEWFDKVTTLPKNWCFKVTEENYEKFKHLRQLTLSNGYITSISYGNLSWGSWCSFIPSNYEEIPFEMFEYFILKPIQEKIKENKMEKKLIGYKLNGKVTVEQLAKLLDCNENTKDCMFFWEPNLKSPVVQRAKNLGILDIWFNPVYEEPYKVGDWVIFEGYSSDYDGKAVQITKIESDFYVYFTPSEKSSHNASMAHIKRKATQEEIEEVETSQIEIQDYKAKFDKESVTFGCMTFTKEDLDNLFQLEQRGIILFNKPYYEKIHKIFKHFLAI